MNLCVYVLSRFSPVRLCPWDNPMNCSWPGYSVHEILQARILEWDAMTSSRGSFQCRGQTHISFNSCITGRFFTVEPQGKPMTNLYSILKSRDITLRQRSLESKLCFFPSSHVWMWELDCKEGWVAKNWCFQTVVLEKTLENPLNSKEIKPANAKGNQYWLFIGRTDAKLKLQYFGHLTQRADSLEKTLMLGKTEAKRIKDKRKWNGWMTLSEQQTWVWANSGRQWRTGKPGKQQSMGLQKELDMT